MRTQAFSSTWRWRNPRSIFKSRCYGARRATSTTCRQASSRGPLFFFFFMQWDGKYLRCVSPNKLDAHSRALIFIVSIYIHLSIVFKIILCSAVRSTSACTQHSNTFFRVINIHKEESGDRHSFHSAFYSSEIMRNLAIVLRGFAQRQCVTNS